MEDETNGTEELATICLLRTSSSSEQGSRKSLVRTYTTRCARDMSTDPTAQPAVKTHLLSVPELLAVALGSGGGEFDSEGR